MPDAQNLKKLASDYPFLRGDGPLAELIASFDWSKTSLGPIETWPVYVTSTISTMLRSRLPITTLWGDEGIMIYNDSYAKIAAERHPQLLGSPVREGWSEVASFNDNVLRVVLAGNTLSYHDIDMILNRRGIDEQVWFDLDYSPVLDDAGNPAGVLAICIETTSKVIAERWRNSEIDRQRQMFEQAPGFIAVLSGPAHVFELTNAAYMQLVGHRDVLGLSVRNALPEIAGQGFFELLDQVYTSGEAYIGKSIEASLQRLPGADSEIRLIDFVYQPVRDPVGNVTGIFVQGMDITERQMAEEALRKSEAQLRAFAESMPNHVWTAQPDGSLDWFNHRVYEYSGRAPGELDGDQWTSIVHPDDLPEAARRWAQAIATGNPYEVEFRLRRSDGQYYWHIGRAVPLRDTDGKILQWIGTNTDFDEHRRIAMELRESERRLKLSQDAAGISSLEVDVASGMVYGSDSLWKLWGLSPRDSIHISELEAIVIPEDRHVRSTAETRANGTSVPHVEYRIRRPDNGAIRWLSRHIEFIHDESGKPVKMFGVMHDVTDRREAEARQKMLTHELEHRIKNLLAMVAATATRTLKNADLDTARESFLQRIRALGEAHDIMNETRWLGASMRQIVDATITALPTDQISVSGPAVPLNPRMGLTLVLAVNELATNALKYGALSVPEGRVSINWSLDPAAPEGQSFMWRWQEQHGPAATPPTRRGFGSFLLQRVFAADFGGTVEFDYRSHGLMLTLIAPTPGAE